MDISVLIEIRVDTQCLCPASQAAIGRLSGFLHHITQVSGQLQLAGALHYIDLYFQNFAAGLCPCKAVHHADFLPVHMDRRRIGLHIQQLRQVFFCNSHSLYSFC